MTFSPFMTLCGGWSSFSSAPKYFGSRKTKSGNDSLVAYVLEELVDHVVVRQVFGKQVAQQEPGRGEVVEVILPTPAGLVETVEESLLRLLKIASEIGDSGRHQNAPQRSPREREEAVRPGRSRHRRVPSVANREVVRQGVQSGQEVRREIIHDLLPVLRG